MFWGNFVGSFWIKAVFIVFNFLCHLSSGFVILWLFPTTCRRFQKLVLKWCLESVAQWWYWHIAYWVLELLDCLFMSWEWDFPPAPDTQQPSLALYLPTKPLLQAGVCCPSVCLKQSLIVPSLWSEYFWFHLRQSVILGCHCLLHVELSKLVCVCLEPHLTLEF